MQEQEEVGEVAQGDAKSCSGVEDSMERARPLSPAPPGALRGALCPCSGLRLSC